jgi:uncharacterized small protein (DUF1192 family)
MSRLGAPLKPRAGRRSIRIDIIGWGCREKRDRNGGGKKMDDEELLPSRKPVPPKDLSLLGIAELEDYIAGLESEIARARAEIAEKQKHRGGAEALFKR